MLLLKGVFGLFFDKVVVVYELVLKGNFGDMGLLDLYFEIDDVDVVEIVGKLFVVYGKYFFSEVYVLMYVIYSYC